MEDWQGEWGSAALIPVGTVMFPWDVHGAAWRVQGFVIADVGHTRRKIASWNQLEVSYDMNQITDIMAPI
jgi:hypothetical protein